MKNYTKIPNEIIEESQLSIPARYLLCVLLKHCGKKEWCFPGQASLAKNLNRSVRYIRILINELVLANLVYKERTGFNKSNTYHVAKLFSTERKPASPQLGKKDSCHLRSTFPLHQGNEVPPNNTYIKGKDKKSLERMREALESKRIVRKSKIILKQNYEKNKN